MKLLILALGKSKPMQSKKHSILEILANTASGFIVSLTITTFLIPYMATVGAFGVTCIFTVVSLVRSYVWRRLFNKKAIAAMVAE